MKFTRSLVKCVENDIYLRASSQAFAHFKELAHDFAFMLEMEVLVHHKLRGLADCVSEIWDRVFGAELIHFMANYGMVHLNF